MDSSIFRLSLDIHRQTTQGHLAVMKGDTARKIVAALSDGGRPYRIAEGCYAVFKGKKPDGNVLYNDCAIANNCITYEFTEQTAASAGHMACEFQLYGADGQLITSPRLAIIVNGLVYDDSEVESSGEFTALEKAMADVAELKANGLRGDPGPVGPEGPQGPRGETPFYVDLAVHGDGSWYADEGFDTIRQEYNSGRQVVCRLELDQQFLELPMVKEAAGVFTFGAIIGGQEWQAIISPGEDGAAAVTVGSSELSTLRVTVTGSKDPDTGTVTYAADATKDEIAEADAQHRVVECLLSNRRLLLDTVTASAAAFSCLYKSTHHRVTVYSDGNVKYETFQLTMPEDLKPTATDEKYFYITEDGVIRLKPEYRGASESTKMVDSVSDRGRGLDGSKLRDLPEEIVIPETVNGIAVTGYADGMFYRNTRPKKITLLGSVTVLPYGFCSYCLNLCQVEGTQGITSLGRMALAYTAITEANFPSVAELDAQGGQFQNCANLLTANLGNTISQIPAKCFASCEKLTTLEGCGNVTALGDMALCFSKNLRELPFRDNLTDIGRDALFLSRADWGASEGFISSDIVPEYSDGACSIRMRSTFEQHDPRWANKYIVYIDKEHNRKYHVGCMYVSAAMVYSAYKKEEMFSPEEFVEAMYRADADLAKIDIAGMDSPEGLVKLVEAMGCTYDLYESVTNTSISAVYAALKTGNLVIARIAGDNNRETDGTLNSTNHIVVCYGINENGEIMVVDSSAASSSIGIYEASVYTMPIHNLCRPGDFFMVVHKPA